MKLILFEAACYLLVFGVWYGFRRFLHRNITGDMLAGTMVGACIEFGTEPLWEYHFHITVYRDTPLVVVLGWGMMFSLAVYFSEKFYRFFLSKDSVKPYDKRIFLFDVMGGAVVGLPMEALGLRMGVWDYNQAVLHWHAPLPIVGLPPEVMIGYGLLMLLAPTFVRYWQGAFEGQRPYV